MDPKLDVRLHIRLGIINLSILAARAAEMATLSATTPNPISGVMIMTAILTQGENAVKMVFIMSAHNLYLQSKTKCISLFILDSYYAIISPRKKNSRGRRIYLKNKYILLKIMCSAA